MSKTPVSLLQEQMMRKGQTPHYELIMDGTGSHEPIFKYKVIASNVFAFGTGRSKKEAKHDAAKRALEKLQVNFVDTENPEPLVYLTDVESPYKDKMQENSVGQLAELCALNNLPSPEYCLVSDEGPAHAKEFVMSCTVSNIFQTGKGRTKKLAKHMAAQKLLTRLKDSLEEVKPENTAEIESKNLKETLRIIEKHEAKALQLTSPRVTSYKLRNSTDALEGTTCDTLSRIQNEENDTYDEPFCLLEQIASELGAEFQVQELPTIETNNSKLVMILFVHIYEIVMCGKGQTEEVAKNEAASEMIHFLKFMCQKPKTS